MTGQPSTAIEVNEIDSGIVVMKLDMPGSGANILGEALFGELDETMEQLANRDDIDGLILFSGKPNIFIAGADLNAIVATLDWPDKEIIKFCERGRAVMARFSRCPFVSVAAIHGACVGGGLELPLWCDHRIASNDRRTKLGLPEVKLGLIPGWAGTVRLPRIAGFATAADLITSGRLVSAEEANRLGFIDAVVDPDELISTATEMIRQAQSTGSYIEGRRAIMGPVKDLSGLPEIVERVGQQIVDNQEVFPFAPTVALEHMARSAPMPQPEAWKSESVAMAQVYGSPANRGLLNHFFLTDHNKKHPGLVDLNLEPGTIKTVGVVGGGLMGRAIAENCLRRGFSVVILDAVADIAQAVANDLKDLNPEATIAATVHYEDFAQVELVIESVVETFDVKKIVLQKIEQAVSKQTVIASNTSAIPIGKLASVMGNPRNFCGIHFCHPELMSLVEVVCGPQSSEQTIAMAVGFVRSLKKMAVAMNDGAGFVVNRLLGAMLDQSFRLVTQGVPVEAIDDAMREFGFQGGPFEIIDVIGAETCMYAGRTMWESGLRCVTLSPILPRMVKLGRLGRKAGVGFYRYPDPRGPRQPDEGLAEIIASYVTQSETEQESSSRVDPQKIVTEILSAIVLEATHILDEEMVADFRDIDLCVIHGFSFPSHRGGILFWADQTGLKTVNQTLYKIAEVEPRMEPSELLKTMRLGNKRFYGNQAKN